MCATIAVLPRMAQDPLPVMLETAAISFLFRSTSKTLTLYSTLPRLTSKVGHYGFPWSIRVKQTRKRNKCNIAVKMIKEYDH